MDAGRSRKVQHEDWSQKQPGHCEQPRIGCGLRSQRAMRSAGRVPSLRSIPCAQQTGLPHRISYATQRAGCEGLLMYRSRRQWHKHNLEESTVGW
jgi:hypothetical protein